FPEMLYFPGLTATLTVRLCRETLRLARWFPPSDLHSWCTNIWSPRIRRRRARARRWHRVLRQRRHRASNFWKTVFRPERDGVDPHPGRWVGPDNPSAYGGRP